MKLWPFGYRIERLEPFADRLFLIRRWSWWREYVCVVKWDGSQTTPWCHVVDTTGEVLSERCYIAERLLRAHFADGYWRPAKAHPALPEARVYKPGRKT